MQTRLWWRLLWGLAESAFVGSLESGGRFCVGAFDRNLASVAVKMFKHFIYFLRNVINVVLSMRFAKIMLQYIVLLFNTKDIHSRQF
jgi:hypothetical protein